MLSLLLPLLLPLTHAILPTATIQLLSPSTPLLLLASQASFGPPPPDYSNRLSSPLLPALPPSYDSYLCSPANATIQVGVVLIAPRGRCSFQRKAAVAQSMGAEALVIYGTLSSRYSFNSTQDLMIWPMDKYDYDCEYGETYLSSGEYGRLNFEGGYDERNDGYLEGVCDNNKGCASDKCLVTGENRTNGVDVEFRACCAWDLHVWLYADSSMNETIAIPTVYITVEEGEILLDMIQGAEDRNEERWMIMYERYVPKYNGAAVLIWALGVFVAGLASWMSSGEYRQALKKVILRRKWSEETDRSGGGSREDVPGRSEEIMERGEERTIYRSPGHDLPARDDQDSLELTASHALGFIVMSSTSLLVLFYFKIYGIVKIMYAVGCSGAFMQIIVQPAMTYACLRMRWDVPLEHLSCLTEEKASRDRMISCLWETFGPISTMDILTAMISYGVGATWLFVGFHVPHPDTVVFYWIVQDLFGLCMCVLFLSTVKLNALRVAAILLTVAFFYDIFFVFVTPLLTKHGESIMVNVATSGGPPKADPSWCEKYPFDAECKGGDPLPMLFAIPRIGDYQGGCSMLGLGDIVLPGLLLSFASRYDEAKRLIGVIGGGSGRMRNNACPDLPPQHKSSNPLCLICCCCRQGYFGPVMVAYAIGLAMANAAVYIMQMGQPALLYLVPCCLGTMMYIGHKSGELSDLWDGPRVIKAADALLNGEQRVEVGEEEGRERRIGDGNEVQMGKGTGVLS